MGSRGYHLQGTSPHSARVGDTSVTFNSQPCCVSGSRVRSQRVFPALLTLTQNTARPLVYLQLALAIGWPVLHCQPQERRGMEDLPRKEGALSAVGNIRLAAVDAHAGCSRQSVACHSQIPGPGAYVASPLPQLSCTLCCGLQPHHGVSDAGTPQMTKLPAGSAVLRNLLFRARWCEATTRRTSAMPSCSSRLRSTRTAPTTAETRLHSPSRCAGHQRWASAC